jgi:hypothetical protein
MDNFNKLTPAQTERLAILVEECGEVIQIGMKILRHGYRSYHPDDLEKISNQSLLSVEIGHVKQAIQCMMRNEDISPYITQLSSERKEESIKKYLHHQTK